MPITIEQSVRDVRTILGDIGKARFSNADLLDILDEGQKEVSALTLGYQKRVTFADTDAIRVLMPSVREYAISGSVGGAGLGIGDSIRVLHIFLDGTSLPLWTPEMVPHADHRSTGGSVIRYWYGFAGRVGFVPFPDSTFVTATVWNLEVVYAAYPPDWSSGASVLHSGLDELPTLFAVVRALLAKRAWTDAYRLFEQYMQLAQQYRQTSLIQAATPRQALTTPTQNGRVDEPRRVRVAGGRR